MGKAEILQKISQLKSELHMAKVNGSIINQMAIERAIRELENVLDLMERNNG